ncbi:MAG TPA: hypothetical protein VJU77_03420 [Chthoniobacterales bacterium]|nr:hypothetical protein [Chthoniobacterales bacterium]
MTQSYEFEIIAIAPDTAADIAQKIMPAIKDGLREHGHESLLEDREIQVDQKENFPDMDYHTVIILVHVATNIAYDVFKTYAIPQLRKLGEVREPKQKSDERRADG